MKNSLPYCKIGGRIQKSEKEDETTRNKKEKKFLFKT